MASQRRSSALSAAAEAWLDADESARTEAPSPTTILAFAVDAPSASVAPTASARIPCCRAFISSPFSRIALCDRDDEESASEPGLIRESTQGPVETNRRSGQLSIRRSKDSPVRRISNIRDEGHEAQSAGSIPGNGKGE